MKFRAYLTLFLIIASLSLSAQNNTSPSSEQFTISGKVLNQKDKKPIANANVFINNTTIGTETDKAGNFTLYNIKPGKYKLVISIIGFDHYSREVSINHSNINLPDIAISPKTTALKEVSIKSKNNGRLYFNMFYEAFKNEFLGTSELAKDCKILNPDALYIDFDEETNILTATSSGFLEIENKDLGYNIKYLLTDFKLTNNDQKAKELRYEGSVLFTKMKGTPGQERRWEQRRQDTYEGSSMHFLRAALSDQLGAEGFKVLRLTTYSNPDRPADSLIKAKIKELNSFHGKYSSPGDSLDYWKKKAKLPKMITTLVPYALNKTDIISMTDEAGTFAFGCDSDRLLITYDKNGRFPEFVKINNINFIKYILNKPNNKEFTLINFATPFAFFNSNGGVVNPYSLDLSGVWSKSRVAELLPTDYEPAQGKSIEADAFQQNDTLLRSTINRLTTFSTKYPAEKVYLHLDKPGGYFFGDTIWYKAYTLTGTHHQLSALSGVLYVELINPKDSVVTRQTLQLVSGVAWGDIPLPRTLKQGGYRLRAYTNWMRNIPDCFYDENIRIGGIAPALVKPIIAKNPDVQFFPEGGQLVDGVRSRVAVKSIGTNGLGEDIKGTIEDNEGNVITDFATRHLGMGVFALTPQSGKSYRAKVTIPGETAFTVDLPKAETAGYTLAVNNSDKDSLYIKVAVNEKILNEQKNNAFYILAQNNGKVYYTSQGKLENLVYSAKVEKNRFPTGITQFTLFNQNGEPLAERISFIQGDDSVKLDISSADQTYTTRQKVKIDIKTKDNTGNQAAGSFSVAVINESRAAADENTGSTILNNLLLTSELKGYIEQPNYYFTNNNGEQKQADLDVLMLTQGYRRFEWKQVLSNTQPEPIYQPEKSLEITGVLKTPGGKAVPNGKITLVAIREKSALDTVTDVNGNFKFSNIDLPDTAKITLQARKENNGSNVTIYVKQPEYPAVTHPKNTGMNINQEILTGAQTTELDKSYAEYQKQVKEDSLKNGKQLKGVTITARKLSKPDIYNNYGAAEEYRVDMKRLTTNFIRITDALIHLIPGITGGPHVFYYEEAGPKPIPVKVVIDGQVRIADDLNYYLPAEVDNIRMVSHVAPNPSILVLTTKRYAGTDTASAIKLKEVKINAIKTNNRPELTHSANLNGPGNANQVIMGDKLEGCITISDCLLGRVMGVTFASDGTPYSVRRGGPMVIIVDGIMMAGSHLKDINAHDIYSIEVLYSAAYLSIYGSNAHNGALVITTRRGVEPTDDKYTTTEVPAGLITYPFKGYHKAKTFYSPLYTHAKTDTEPLDLRGTIYWNPNIITDKDGNASFEYFNADTKGTYRVVVEGIDDNGNLGRQVYRYKVE